MSLKKQISSPSNDAVEWVSPVYTQDATLSPTANYDAPTIMPSTGPFGFFNQGYPINWAPVNAWCGGYLPQVANMIYPVLAGMYTSQVLMNPSPVLAMQWTPINYWSMGNSPQIYPAVTVFGDLVHSAVSGARTLVSSASNLLFEGRQYHFFDEKVVPYLRLIADINGQRECLEKLLNENLEKIDEGTKSEKEHRKSISAEAIKAILLDIDKHASEAVVYLEKLSLEAGSYNDSGFMFDQVRGGLAILEEDIREKLEPLKFTEKLAVIGRVTAIDASLNMMIRIETQWKLDRKTLHQSFFKDLTLTAIKAMLKDVNQAMCLSTKHWEAVIRNYYDTIDDSKAPHFEEAFASVLSSPEFKENPEEKWTRETQMLLYRINQIILRGNEENDCIVAHQEAKAVLDKKLDHLSSMRIGNTLTLKRKDEFCYAMLCLRRFELDMACNRAALYKTDVQLNWRTALRIFVKSQDKNLNAAKELFSTYDQSVDNDLAIAFNKQKSKKRKVRTQLVKRTEEEKLQDNLRILAKIDMLSRFRDALITKIANQEGGETSFSEDDVLAGLEKIKLGVEDKLSQLRGLKAKKKRAHKTEARQVQSLTEEERDCLEAALLKDESDLMAKEKALKGKEKENQRQIAELRQRRELEKKAREKTERELLNAGTVGERSADDVSESELEARFSQLQSQIGSSRKNEMITDYEDFIAEIELRMPGTSKEEKASLGLLRLQVKMEVVNLKIVDASGNLAKIDALFKEGAELLSNEGSLTHKKAQAVVDGFWMTFESAKSEAEAYLAKQRETLAGRERYLAELNDSLKKTTEAIQLHHERENAKAKSRSHEEKLRMREFRKMSDKETYTAKLTKEKEFLKAEIGKVEDLNAQSLRLRLSASQYLDAWQTKVTAF